MLLVVDFFDLKLDAAIFMPKIFMGAKYNHH